jgi:hypothetical protein
MPPVGFQATIPASARPKTHALDRPASGMMRYIQRVKLRRQAEETSARTSYQVMRGIKLIPETENMDPKALRIDDLHKNIPESDSLSETLKVDLFTMLLRYNAQFTSKPGL